MIILYKEKNEFTDQIDESIPITSPTPISPKPQSSESQSQFQTPPQKPLPPPPQEPLSQPSSLSSVQFLTNPKILKIIK